MSIPPDNIEAGKWYLAKGGRAPRVRRVIRVLSDGRVQYEQRSPKTAWQRGIQHRDVFASMLQLEVSCDWMPEQGDNAS